MSKLEFEVCVYGTLKRGYGNHRIIENGGGEFVRNLSIPGFVMFDLGAYPCIIPSCHNNAFVHTEVYAVSRATLTALDTLEGHPHFYERLTVDSQFGRHFVYAYTPNSFRSSCLFRAPLRWVMDGEWKRPADPEMIYDIKTFDDLPTIVDEKFLKHIDFRSPLQQRTAPCLDNLPVPTANYPKVTQKEKVYRVTRNVEA